MGGIVTVQAIEQANIGNVIGGLTVCGAIAGSHNWDGALDARLLYDTVCGQVPGALIPGGAYGLPKNSTFTQADLGAAINACFGLLQPGGPSLAQAQRLGLFLGVTKLPVGFVGTVMGFATFGLADLVYDPGKLSGQLGTGNVGVDYGEPFVNNAIARVASNPGARTKLLANYSPTGNTRGARIVSLHTDKDGLVIVENEREYAERAPANRFTTAIVREDAATHCGFNGAELLASWESLRAWLAGGTAADARDDSGHVLGYRRGWSRAGAVPHRPDVRDSRHGRSRQAAAVVTVPPPGIARPAARRPRDARWALDVGASPGRPMLTATGAGARGPMPARRRAAPC